MGLPAKLFTPPQRPQNPAAVISETHMCINQAIEHLTIHLRLCAWVFHRCRRHLWYLALETGLSLIDRILSNPNWLGQTNLNIWGWHTTSGTTCEWPHKSVMQGPCSWLGFKTQDETKSKCWLNSNSWKSFPRASMEHRPFHALLLFADERWGGGKWTIISLYIELLSERLLSSQAHRAMALCSSWLASQQTSTKHPASCSGKRHSWWQRINPRAMYPASNSSRGDQH